MCDLEYVSERVAHHGPPVAIRRVDGRLDAGGARPNCSPV